MQWVPIIDREVIQIEEQEEFSGYYKDKDSQKVNIGGLK